MFVIVNNQCWEWENKLNELIENDPILSKRQDLSDMVRELVVTGIIEGGMRVRDYHELQKNFDYFKDLVTSDFKKDR